MLARIFAGVSLLVVAQGCHSASLSPILADGAPDADAFEVAVVDAEEARLVEAEFSRSDVVARFDDDGRVAYVVSREAAEGVRTAEFEPLDHVTMVVRVRRMGDDGDGTLLNAEVVERVAEVHFTGADVSRAFAELHALETNPWRAVEQSVPGLLAQVSDMAPAYAFEKGFRVELDVSLRGGNPTDRETHATLYTLTRSSAYRSTALAN